MPGRNLGNKHSGRIFLAPVCLLGLLLVLPSCTGSEGDPVPGRPLTYYVSCAGHDGARGTSSTAPWATLTRASKQDYRPGDQILLQRGCVWNGTLQATGSGTAASPVVVSDYGTGTPPRLVGDKASALVLRNVSGWTVQDLDLTQVGQTPQPLDSTNEHGKDHDPNSDQHMKPVVDVRALGPSGTRNCGASCTDSDITLRNLVVHDGQWDGIYVGAGYSDPDKGVFGYVRHITIQGVESRGNQAAGIDLAGTFTREITYQLSDVAVLDSYVHDNGGDGAVMGQVQRGLIQGNRCAYNGRIRNARVGCWAWDSKGVTIQYNEADHNMTPLEGPAASDGGGLDLDMGAVDSTMQYNWTHDNEGEGYLLEGPAPGEGFQSSTSNDTVRYNVSERDGQKESGGITVVGGVNAAWIYNNTVYHVATRPADTNILSGTGGDLTTLTYGDLGSPVVHVDNNVFLSDGRANPTADDTNFWSDGKATLFFDHNLWDRIEGGVAFHMGGSELTSWAAWQGRGFDAHGENRDPGMTGPLGSGPTGYQLQSGSAAIGLGANLTQAPLGMGDRDYFGTQIPRSGGYDLGALAHTSTPSTRNSNATVAPQVVVSPSVHVASLETTGSSGKPAPGVARGSTVYWQVGVTDANGSPVSGVRVTTVVYSPSWDSIYASVNATTDSTGTARFSHKSANRDPVGSYFFFLSQVVPASASLYYDSSQDAASTNGFSLR
jgi:hypothetical protein